MTYWSGAYFKVRIWGKEGFETKPFVEALDGIDSEKMDDFVACLDAMEGVSAFEVVDFDGQGVCVYADWP